MIFPMTMRLFAGVILLCVAAVDGRAQTSTWKASPTSNAFGTASNWVLGTAPVSGDALVFSSTSFTSPTLSAAFSTSGITFSSSYPRYFLSGNGTSTLSIGSGGITLDGTGTSTNSSSVDFNSSLPLTLTASQNWTTTGSSGSNLTVNGTLSGASSVVLTKLGGGYLALNANNPSYAGNIVVSAGTLYLGQSNSAGTGTITIGGAGTLGLVSSSVTIDNPVSISGSGATLGGSLNNGNDSELKFSNTVTVPSGTSTLNVAGSEVSFPGTLTAASANANLTVHGTGTAVAILGNSATNFGNLTADNAGIVFGKTSTLPTTSIQATNGGYVSVAELTSTTSAVSGSTPTVSALLALITNKAGFNGMIGFDSGDQTQVGTIFSEDITLTGFTAGNVSLSSSTGAVLTGNIILPAGASDYSFKGFGSQGGILVVKSNLTNDSTGTTIPNTTVTVTSNNSGGVGNGGLGVVLQGTNSFSGILTVNQSGVILDSATALPSKQFSMGNNSYVGITENATGYSNFAAFASNLTSYTATSVLGLDSHTALNDLITTGNVAGSGSIRTVTDPIDLSGKTAIFLGTVTGVTIDNSVTITAPSDHALRLVNLGDKAGNLTINAPLTSGNGVTTLVAGLPGSNGSIVLTNSTNNYTGGTTLQGGSLLVSNGSALGAGNITALSTSSGNIVLGASAGSVTLTNNIAITDNLQVGTGVNNDNGTFTAGTTNLTLSGTISTVSNNGTNGRLYITGPTVINGTNTYSGGTYVEANTTANSNSPFGTFFVDIGYGANLTFTSATPAISVVADAGNFIGNAGTGNVILNSGVNLTINGTSGGTFTGNISGAGAITKNGTATQTFNGTNSFSGGVTISGGTLSVSTINDGSSNGGLGAATNAAANLVFDGGTLQYTGGTTSTDRNFTINTGKTATISVTNGSANLTMSGASTATNGALTKTGGGTLILSGANLYTGATSVNGGKLFVNGSLANSAVTVASGATLGGTGSIAGGVNFLSGGRLAPGVTTGTLTFTNGLTLQTGAIFDFQLGTSSDKIFVTGGQLIGPAGNNGVTLNLTNSGSFGVGSYTLVDFGGATLNGFELTDFAFGTTISGFSSSLSFSGNTLVLTASAIPEPSTYAALLGATALAATVWRRRRVQVSQK